MVLPCSPNTCSHEICSKWTLQLYMQLKSEAGMAEDTVVLLRLGPHHTHCDPLKKHFVLSRLSHLLQRAGWKKKKLDLEDGFIPRKSASSFDSHSSWNRSDTTWRRAHALSATDNEFCSWNPLLRIRSYPEHAIFVWPEHTCITLTTNGENCNGHFFPRIGSRVIRTRKWVSVVSEPQASSSSPFPVLAVFGEKLRVQPLRIYQFFRRLCLHFRSQTFLGWVSEFTYSFIATARVNYLSLSLS